MKSRCNKCNELFARIEPKHKYCDECHDKYLSSRIIQKELMSQYVCDLCKHNKTRKCHTYKCLNVVTLCASCCKLIDGLDISYCGQCL